MCMIMYPTVRDAGGGASTRVALVPVNPSVNKQDALKIVMSYPDVDIMHT